jgi:hypothetical protein
MVAELSRLWFVEMESPFSPGAQAAAGLTARL